MAQLLEKLEDQLKCPICLDMYTNPKQLQCNHVYCQKCLVRLVARDQQGRLSLTCPNCRHVTPAPTSGVAGLQAAFRVNRLLEIVDEQKKVTSDASAGLETENAAIASPNPLKNGSVVCNEHSGEAVELYCEACGETICRNCLNTGGKHHNHKCTELSEAYEEYKDELSLLLEPVETRLASLKESLTKFDVCRAEISAQQSTIEANIHSTFTQLHESLDARKTTLINQLHQLTQDKLKSLLAVRDQLEKVKAELSRCLLFMREDLETSSQAEALMMRNTLISDIKELTNSLSPRIVEPNTKADLIFSALADLKAECQNYGRVYEADSPDLSNSYATVMGKVTAMVGEKSAITFRKLDSNFNIGSLETNSISCELVSTILGTRARCVVEERGQGLYCISYQPTIKGRHHLLIRVEGQHIRGSPFPVSVMSPVEKLGTPIMTISGVTRPEGVAVNQRGEVIVFESGCCVSVFSPRGERLQSFSVQNSKNYFDSRYPVGVAVDAEGNIYVACDNGSIKKFTFEGELLAEVFHEKSMPPSTYEPRGIAYNASNHRVYVVDSTKDRIHILNSDLSDYRSFGKAGKGKGQFFSIQHIACDSIGNLYVVDGGNYRIQVFSAEGKFLRMFGAGDESMGEPYGIGLDSSDRVYVSLKGNGCVWVFTSKGEFLTSFGSCWKGPGQLRHLFGLAVDRCGVVYLCDNLNHCVLVF